MLKDVELFESVEKFLKQQETFKEFEKEKGEIRGRMMITEAVVPEELGITIDDEKAFAFECSFDFYECSIGIVLNTETKQALSGVWITREFEGAESPDKTWVEFFFKTLVNHISDDGTFGLPMYTFLWDEGDVTIVPTAGEVE